MILDKGEHIQLMGEPEAPPPPYEEHAEFVSNTSSSRAAPQHEASYPDRKHRETVYAYAPGRDDPEPQAPSFPIPHIYPASHISSSSGTTESPSDTSNYSSAGFGRTPFANNPDPYSIHGGFGRGRRRTLSQGCSSPLPPLLPPSTPNELLNPPPPSFSRPPQPGFPYGPFPILAHFSQGIAIEGGFAAMPPPTHIDPHPFATHDVSEEDWARFLDDIRRAGSLSPWNKFTVGAAPFAVGIGIIGGGIIVAKGLYDHIKTKKHACAAEIVDHWNNNFFHHRQMEVSLCRGSIKYSGIDRTPPDMPYPQDKVDQPNDHESEGESSADEATTENPSRGCPKREARRERRELKRVMRQQRKQYRKEEKEVKSKPWRLVISYRPLPSV